MSPDEPANAEHRLSLRSLESLDHPDKWGVHGKPCYRSQQRTCHAVVGCDQSFCTALDRGTTAHNGAIQEHVTGHAGVVIAVGPGVTAAG
jgi:hypothetical protein